jgi:hypothetical protein
MLSMVYFLSNWRGKIINNFPGVEFLWRHYDVLYFDLLEEHAALVCDSHVCGWVLNPYYSSKGACLFT